MICRLRKFKKRWGIVSGPAYVGIHLGKRSWYVPHHGRGKVFSINEWRGLTEVTKHG